MPVPKLLETCRVLDQQLQRQLSASTRPAQHPPSVEPRKSCQAFSALSLQQDSVEWCGPSLTDFRDSIMESISQPQG